MSKKKKPTRKQKSALENFTLYIGDAVIPKKYRKDIVKYVRTAGIQRSPYELFGLVTWFVAFLTLLANVFIVNLGPLSTSMAITKIIIYIVLLPITFTILMLIAQLLIKWTLDAAIYKRLVEMEDIFPEFLTEMSLNLKSGQDLEDAIRTAAREDFGQLSEEMTQVATRIDLGFDLQESIEDFTSSYKSELIAETFELIIISWKKGAKTPKLIDRMIENMKSTRYLKQKIVASVANYRIFLATVTVLIAPAMMALAFHVIDLIRSITTEVMQVTQNSVLPFTVNAVRFVDSHFIWFSVLTLATISLCSAMIITYINSGTVKGGYKLMFLYVAGGLLSYAVFMVVFSGFFTLFAV